MSCVLVIRFSALGDVAMSLPVVYDACRANPDVRFVFLTRKHPSRLFINSPKNLEVTGIDTSDYAGAGGLYRLYGELKERYGFDTIVDLHDVLRTKVLRTIGRLRGDRVSTIIKGRGEKRALTRKRNKVLLPLQKTSERYRDTFHRAGIEAPESFRSIFGDKEVAAERYALLTPPKEDGEVWIGVAPFAKHAGKIYPPEKMAEVVREVSLRPRHKVFLFGGGEKECGILSGWSGGNVINVADTPIGVEGELALISHLDTMLSMDSANMHLASLTGTRTVSIWGATHPYTGFLGRAQDPADTIQLEMPCRPCSIFGNKECINGNYPCLQDIPVSTILSRLP